MYLIPSAPNSRVTGVDGRGHQEHWGSGGPLLPLGFNQPTYRGMRINGQRVATWSSQHGWSGDSRPEAEWLQ
jgi:hypothetical protein